MPKTKFYEESQIEIGDLTINCPDDDGDFSIKLRQRNSMFISTEDAKDIVEFLQWHIKQSE